MIQYKPQPNESIPWSTMEKLSKEKKSLTYISCHPLDDYKFEIDNFLMENHLMLYKMENIKGKELRLAELLREVEHKETKTGVSFGILHLEIIIIL